MGYMLYPTILGFFNFGPPLFADRHQENVRGDLHPTKAMVKILRLVKYQQP